MGRRCPHNDPRVKGKNTGLFPLMPFIQSHESPKHTPLSVVNGDWWMGMQLSNVNYEKRDNFQLEVAAVEQANRREQDDFERQASHV